MRLDSIDDAVDQLNSLIQLDVDAAHGYSQAINNVDILEIRTMLESFRADHQRHVRDLTTEIIALGGKPVEATRDFKGYLIEGMTAIRSLTGTAGAVKAMRMNEQLSNMMYEKALKADLPLGAREIVRRNREDERRHLEYIDSILADEPWAKKSIHGTSSTTGYHIDR